MKPTLEPFQLSDSPPVKVEMMFGQFQVNKLLKVSEYEIIIQKIKVILILEWYISYATLQSKIHFFDGKKDKKKWKNNNNRQSLNKESFKNYVDRILLFFKQENI